MTTTARTDMNELFWANATTIKAKKAPKTYWREICDSCGINYQTFRGRKSRGVALEGNSLKALADYFEVEQTYFFQPIRPATRTARRDRVSEEIYRIDDKTFDMIERMLGLD
jgi:hypothetical protein